MNAFCRPPLVSIIVTNYNYGRFLMEALTAVRNQTYPHVECIVVDDCSADESRDVLERAALSWPELIVIHMETNGGQSAASLAGFTRASGQFVVFLDADDQILPEFVATHVATHFSLRAPVGMTCCDTLTLKDGRLVCATWRFLSDRFAQIPVDPTLVSDHGLATLRLSGVEMPDVEARSVRLVRWDERWWPWSTMSAMMFRRDALDLVIDAEGLEQMRIGTDCFLARAVNRLTGSALIERPMMVYRIHGSNGYVDRALLNHVRPGRAGLAFEGQADSLLLAHLMKNFQRFHAIMDRADHLREICELASRPREEDDPASEQSASPLRVMLSRHFEEIAAALGRSEAAAWLERTKASTREPRLRLLAKLPPRMELEIAKFLCSIGVQRDGVEVFNRAMKRLAESADSVIG